MDLSTGIAVHFYYMGAFFLPFVLFQMFAGGGLRDSRSDLGYVAQACPKCGTAQRFSLTRVGISSGVLFKPMGQGALRGYSGVCGQCAGKYELQATDYDAIEPDGKVPLDKLIAKTNPRLELKSAAADAAFERFGRIREPLIRASRALSVQYDGGSGANFPEGLSFLVAFEMAFWLTHSFQDAISIAGMAVLFAVAFVPMLWLSQKMMDRYGGSYRIGFAAVFALLASLVIPIVAFFWYLSYALSAGLLLAGLAATVLVVAKEPRRFFECVVKLELASALKPLNPTQAELEECLQALRQSGERCRFVEAPSLLNDIADAEARPVAPPVEKAAPPPVEQAPRPVLPGELGECPNCGSRIPLDSAECPIPKCHAVFGPGSEWKIARL